MGGQAPDRPHLTLPDDPQEAARVLRRRLGLVQIALGVPALLVIVFGLVLAYRWAGRPLGDVDFWFVLAAVLAVFGVYFGRALVAVRRASARPSRGESTGEDS